MPDPPTRSATSAGPATRAGSTTSGIPYARIRPRSDDLDLDICENLYAAGTATAAPYWAYHHELPVVPGEDCRENAQGAPINTSLGGLDVLPTAGGNFPAAYGGALFFSDHSRDCIWVMLPGADGLPARGSVVAFAQAADVPARPRVRPARRALLRRQRDRGREAHPLHRAARQPAADRGRAGGAGCRQPAAHGRLRRRQLERSRRRATCSPTHGTSTATASSTTRPSVQPSHTYTSARQSTRSRCG